MWVRLRQPPDSKRAAKVEMREEIDKEEFRIKKGGSIHTHTPGIVEELSLGLQSSTNPSSWQRTWLDGSL